jgi:hypothetical protein
MAAPMNPAMNLTYTQPEIQDISRQRKLSEMLLQQGMQGSKGQMVGNIYVPSHPLEQIADAYAIYKSGKLSKEANTKEQELARQLRETQANEAQDIYKALSGTPEIAEVVPQGQTLRDDQGQITIGSQAGAPAVAGSPQAALAVALRGQSPFAQTMASKLMEQQFKEPKKTTDIQNYEYDVKNSGFKGTFNDWMTNQKKAGATNVSVGGAKDLASQVGDISKESRISAMGAVQSAESANRIISAVDSNKLFTGVGANQRLTAAQIADGLGLGGKDTAEKIANTRQAVQGLAQLTLQGRKQMRGEGAITESEGALAQRAMSGDVSLTAGEIRQLAEAAKRSAKFQYSQHQNIINTMKGDPSTRGLVPYYDVPADINIFNPRVVGGQSNTRNEADKIIGGQ